MNTMMNNHDSISSNNDNSIKEDLSIASTSIKSVGSISNSSNQSSSIIHKNIITLPSESIIISDFYKLGLSSEIITALYNQNINQPTPVQKQVIPRLLNRENLLMAASTGIVHINHHCNHHRHHDHPDHRHHHHHDYHHHHHDNRHHDIIVIIVMIIIIIMVIIMIMSIIMIIIIIITVYIIITIMNNCNNHQYHHHHHYSLVSSSLYVIIGSGKTLAYILPIIQSLHSHELLGYVRYNRALYIDLMIYFQSLPNIHLHIYLFTYLCIFHPIYISTYPPIHISMYLSSNLYFYIFTYSHIYVSFIQSIFLYIYLFIYLSPYLIYLSINSSFYICMYYPSIHHLNM